jgi:hypothetical protein
MYHRPDYTVLGINLPRNLKVRFLQSWGLHVTNLYEMLLWDVILGRIRSTKF